MILIMRTTIDIDDPILEDLKRLQRRDGKPLGRLVSNCSMRGNGLALYPPIHGPMNCFQFEY